MPAHVKATLHRPVADAAVARRPARARDLAGDLPLRAPRPRRAAVARRDALGRVRRPGAAAIADIVGPTLREHIREGRHVGLRHRRRRVGRMRARRAAERGPGRQGRADRGRAAGHRATTSTSRWAGSSSGTPRSTGTTRTRPSRSATAAASTCRAARRSAGRPRSTRWSTSAATAPTTTAGRGRRDRLGLRRPAAVLQALRGQRARRRRVPRRRRAADGLGLALEQRDGATRSSRRPSRPATRANDDFNGAEQDGFGRYQLTQRGGRRCSRRGRLPAPGDGAART